MSDQERAARRTRGQRPRTPFRRNVDLGVTVVLLVLLALGAVALLQVGAVVAFPADACDGDLIRCDYGRISAAAMIASYGPSALLVAAVLVAAIRIHHDRTACFVPLLGIAATVAVLLGAGALVDAAITRGS